MEGAAPTDFVNNFLGGNLSPGDFVTGGFFRGGILSRGILSWSLCRDEGDHLTRSGKWPSKRLNCEEKMLQSGTETLFIELMPRPHRNFTLHPDFFLFIVEE